MINLIIRLMLQIMTHKYSISHHIVVRFLISDDQDYLINKEFIESSDDDATQKRSIYEKKEKINKERKKVFVARNCSNQSCG